MDSDTSRDPGSGTAGPDAGRHPGRHLWWALLVGGAALLVTALVLALTSRAPADFGEEAGRPADPGVATAEQAPPAPPAPRQDVVTPTASPTRPETSGSAPGTDQPTTVPLVPAEARRPATAPEPDTVAPPVGLRIPAVDVAVDVVPVGVAEDGQMEIPESGYDVGWYRYGPVPGQGQGSAVLASHVDTLAEGLGVLARITDLRAGDLVSVTREDGSVVDYQVTGRRTVPKAELDVQGLFDRSGPELLQLVTCGGPWQPERSSYRDNVIVTAEPVPASS